MHIKDETLKRIIEITLVVTLLLITSCAQVTRAPQNNNLSIVGSGNVVSQTRPLSGFDTLEAGLSFDLSIRQGEKFSVVFVADDNLVDYIAAEKIGTPINFDLKDDFTYDISNVTMRVEVTMPELSRLNLNGSSHAHLEGFQST
jgi:putative cell wall-binding protein